VGGENLAPRVVVAESEQDRHRLGCGRRHVEAAHRALVVGAAEVPLCRARVHASHYRQEGIIGDVARQPEKASAVAEPSAPWLAGLEVVVRELFNVVGAGVDAFEGGHTDGHG
jgi:hypothetical protein